MIQNMRTSAPEHFQNQMATEVTEGLEGVICHMDDLLVWGSRPSTTPACTPFYRGYRRQASRRTLTSVSSARQVKFLRYHQTEYSLTLKRHVRDGAAKEHQ